MDLWIRSQDKKRLTKVNDLYIVHDNDNFCDYIGNNMVGHLAKYTKENRALEVLDEIQNILYAFKRIDGKEGKYEDLDLGIKVNMLNYVYEMPKE